MPFGRLKAEQGHRPIANGTTIREPHLEHRHRRANSTTVVHGWFWSMRLLDRPAMLVPAAVAVGANGCDLAVILQEGGRHLLVLAGLLINGGRIAAVAGERSR